MKSILIIDETPLFREYLRLKLAGDGVDVSAGINATDGIAKMRNMVPDLIIVDYHLSKQGYLEVLKQKKANPNTVNIPVIILAHQIDQKRLLELVPYNVKKVFTKPVKIDALCNILAELLDVPFSVDESPCIMEVHVNDDIIFIEIAQGLNHDKMDLLRFKIIELMELYGIRVPKVIVMLSDMRLGFADGPNLEKLLDTVVRSSKAKIKDIRILTRDDFVRKFIEGRGDYPDLEVVSNLQYAMEGLLRGIEKGSGETEKKAELIGDRVLTADVPEERESLALKFDAENSSRTMEDFKETIGSLKIAVVDDDFIIREMIANAFGKLGATVTGFADGDEFIQVMDSENFDLLFLDLMMPKVDGFEVLKKIQVRNISYPVIVLSAVTQRETVIKAYQMGIKSYLVKPIKPDDIFRKSMEILKANF